MNSGLVVKKIIKKNNTVSVEFEYEGEWSKYLTSNLFYCKYDKNIESVPDSIAIIPFLCNILPVSWVFDLNIKLNELDKLFYESIPNIKKGYKEMYSTIDFNGTIEINKIVENREKNKDKYATLFSGGVDAFCTLLRHIDKRPDLITVFGADIKLEDKEGIDNVNDLNLNVAKDFNLNYEKIYTNFKEIFNYYNLTVEIQNMIDGEWWHEFQHGIGIIGLVAPLSYVNGYNTVYIASSYCENQKGQYTCASDPVIDNKLKYADVITIHDGYELNRQDKIKFICKMRKKLNMQQIKLRVCWESVGGKNCSYCEKCYRTMLGIIIEKENPNNYYFNYDEKIRRNMIRFFKKHLEYDVRSKVNYEPIQEAITSNYTKEETPKDLIWFRKVKLESKKHTKLYLLLERVQRKLKNIIKKIIKK